MLTKVAVVLVCLVMLFGLGRSRRPVGQARRTTNVLLGVVVFLLLLILVTAWIKR